MKYIRSPVGMQQEMLQIARLATEYISETVLGLLKNVFIMSFVYEEGGLPNALYWDKIVPGRISVHEYEDEEIGSAMPTFEFMEAWKLSKAKLMPAGQGITQTLYYDWPSMTFDPETFLHGDPEHGDLREDLARILNVEGNDAGFFGGKERRPYWDLFIEDLPGSASIALENFMVATL